MNRETSNSLGVETGLISGGVENAAAAFASLLADEDNRDEGEQRLNADEAGAEADEPTGETDDSDEARETEEAEEEEAQDDESEDGEPEQKAEAPPRYTVKVDGEEREVELPELLNGYSRQQDYTRKTQQLAEERRAFEAEAEAVRGERQVYSKLLSQLEAQLTQGDAPDWDKLYNEDPIAYVREQQLHQDRQRRLEAVRQEQQRLTEESRKEQTQRVQALVAEERAKLLAALPQWSDATVARREREAIKEHATRALGFTPEEVDQIVDHRAVLVLRKAMAYDQLQQGKAQLKEKRQPPAARTAAPGSSSRIAVQSEAKKARQRLAKTGSVRDAAAVFESLLD